MSRAPHSEYFVVNQILSKGLHTSDEECLAYTTALMDKLEETKAEHAEDDAIVDDTAGQAYVEQFAQQTFDRGEKVLRANMVTRQTADTFDAAATFFQLTAIWGPPDEETQKKIKFAKWNAARILRAIKEGTDPNDSNPRLDEADQNEDDISPPSPLDETPPTPLPAPLSGTTNLPPSHLHHPTAITPPSPLSQPSPINPADRVPSPYSRVSVSPAEPSRSDSPSNPPTATSEGFASPAIPPRHALHFPDPTAADSHTPPPVDVRPTFPGPSVMGAPHAPQPKSQHPLAQHPLVSTHGFGQEYPQSQSPANVPPAGAAHQAPTSYPAPAPQVPTSYAPPPVAEGLNLSKAEKHAKWAISALNFDDVPTAIRELRLALETLGAK
ncbi:uncharacterized protein DNG_05247 [Cephalotrichum gorgonifer]|uniref:DUF605 domain-containing protein n=1 Tax=Cephalotrichum gorgonifer TaxID=2041049 RepID=A0AAE8MZK3_9PEZI|nr:uncharacterized protein DNG_05247 [Cephalotrichum gorgonifer]